MEVHVIHDIRSSKIVNIRFDGDRRMRDGNTPPLFFPDDETGRVYRLKSWSDGEFAAEGIAVYVSDRLSDEQAEAADLDHWERLKPC